MTNNDEEIIQDKMYLDNLQGRLTREIINLNIYVGKNHIATPHTDTLLEVRERLIEIILEVERNELRLQDV